MGWDGEIQHPIPVGFISHPEYPIGMGYFRDVPWNGIFSGWSHGMGYFRDGPTEWDIFGMVPSVWDIFGMIPSSL